MGDKWVGEWPAEEFDKLDHDDTGITDDQMAWVLYKLSTFIEQGGGSFRTLVDHLGSDYSTLYCLGGMRFTNAVSEAERGERDG